MNRAVIPRDHRNGDDPATVIRPVMARADSARATRGFVWGCRDRNVGFAVVARKNGRIHAAISKVAIDDDRWTPALTQAGDQRCGAGVCEVTDLVDLSHWPERTRLIVRREPLHPGAQQSLFPSLTGATTPTSPATPSPSINTCAPTPTSKTTSAD